MGAETTIQLRGYTLGNGPAVWIDQDHIQFSVADVRSAEEPYPNRDGVLFGGHDLLGGRDLLVPILVYTGELASKHLRILQLLEHAGDLGQAWRVSDTDLALTLNLGGARLFVCYGRPRPMATEALRTLDSGVVAAILRFRMSQPYIFDSDVVETVATLVSEAESGGLGYPHGYPHGYGSAIEGAASHTAGGRVDTWPVIVLRAGELDTLRDPTIINDSTGERLGLDGMITSDSQWVVDMLRQRVYVTQVGADVMGADPASLAIADRSNAVRHPTDNDWWSLTPEATQVRLTGFGQGTAHILTRGAYWL